MQPSRIQFLAGYILYNLALDGASTIIPFLVAQKFGIETALIIAILLRLLPRIICAPFIARFILKKGAKFTATIAMCFFAIIMVIMPHITKYQLFQATNLAIGLVFMASTPAFITLRSYFIPPGKNINANANFVTIERLLEVLVPPAIGILVSFCAIKYIFYTISLILVLALLTMATMRIHETKSININKASAPVVATPSYRHLLQLFRTKPILFSIFVPSLGYALIIGTIQLFLIFSTIHTFNKPESQWTFLLTMRGIGALLGSLIAPKAIAYLSNSLNMLTIYLWMRLLQVITLAALAWVPTFKGALILLIVAGLPEVVASVCFFTLLQKTLNHQEEGIYHTLGLPLYNVVVMAGTAFGGLYTAHWLTLQQFWLFIMVLALCKVLPFFFYKYPFQRI